MQFYDGWFDVGYGLVIVGLIISLWASWNVKSTFRRYQNDRNSRGLTAAQVARQILDDNGLYQIRIEQIAGNLTDHYDPSGNVIRLSESVYNSTSVAAIGVAAHECGHAVQHEVNYVPMQTLESRYILSGEELTKARKVLTAAALTYVAALLNGILQLLRLLSISKRNNRR